METSKRERPSKRARVRCEPGAVSPPKITPELLTERPRDRIGGRLGSDGFVIRYL